MHHSTTIVTCLYDCSPFSRIGGRGYSWEYYLAPFSNLLLLNSNIVVFTDTVIKEQVEEFFNLNNFTDYIVIVHDLNSYRHSDSIYKLKESLGIIDSTGVVDKIHPNLRNSRNHHICLSKTEFLLRSIKEQFFNTEYFYWVDGGLFHDALIPQSLGGMELCTIPDRSRMWPQNKSSVSSPALFNKLLEKTSKDLTLLGLDDLYVRPFELKDFFENEKITHIIGGLFGGRKETVVDFCEKVNKVIDCLFDKNILSLEEEVLSGVFADSFFEEGYLPFRYWGHDRPDEPSYLEVPLNSDSFYKLFL